MIVFDIAEWIANVLILGIGVAIWVAAAFLILLTLVCAMHLVKNTKLSD